MNNNLNINIDPSKLTAEEQEILTCLVNKGKLEDKPKRWTPNKGDSYFIISGDLKVNRFIWNDDENDKRHFDGNNCFKMREEAESEAEKRRVTAELEIFALEHNNEIDW